jgi:hypothetical protein
VCIFIIYNNIFIPSIYFTKYVLDAQQPAGVCAFVVPFAGLFVHPQVAQGNNFGTNLRFRTCVLILFSWSTVWTVPALLEKAQFVRTSVVIPYDNRLIRSSGFLLTDYPKSITS